jgi:hypothetical protein
MSFAAASEICFRKKGCLSPILSACQISLPLLRRLRRAPFAKEDEIIIELPWLVW